MLGDAFPAGGIDEADRYHIGQDQVGGFARFEQQIVTGLPLAVGVEDQVDDLDRMFHGIAPAIERRVQERLDHRRIVLQHAFRGEQVVAVKIDAAVDGAEQADRPDLLGVLIGLVGRIDAHGIDPSGLQILDVESMVDEIHLTDVESLGGEIGVQLRLVRGDHDLAAGKLMDVVDVVARIQHQRQR